MKQKFEVPYNFDLNLVEKLLPYKDHIDFLYMGSYYEDGTNSRKELVLSNRVPFTWDEYILHVSEIQKYFNIGVLIQNNCTLDLIDKYYNIGIRIFILNDSDLVTAAKEKYNDIRCILSITSVLTLEDIKDNDYSMYDEIVLFFNFCRQVQLLKELPTRYKYVLILNSHCVYNCDRCLEHWRLKADTIEKYRDKEMELMKDHCDIFREDRAFIQPQDLLYFNDYINAYKIVDRVMDTDDIIYEIDRYSKDYNTTRKELSWYMIGGE